MNQVCRRTIKNIVDGIISMLHARLSPLMDTPRALIMKAWADALSWCRNQILLVLNGSPLYKLARSLQQQKSMGSKQQPPSGGLEFNACGAFLSPSPQPQPKTRVAQSLSILRRVAFWSGMIWLSYRAGKVGLQLCGAIKSARAANRDVHTSGFYEQQKHDVVAAIRESRRGPTHSRVEDGLEEQELAPEVKDKDGKIVQAKLSQFLVREHGRVVRDLVVLGKLEFGGVPSPTKANQLCVWRFLFKCCEKRGINPTDTKSAITAALPYVFLPDTEDVLARFDCFSEEARNCLAAYRAAYMNDTPLKDLVRNPLSGKRWRRWMVHTLIQAEEPGLEFTK
nr:MAG: hypothetical protein 1 [Procedovirinae sp.]